VNNIYEKKIRSEKKVSRREVDDCKDWFREERWASEVQLGRYGDKKSALAGRQLASPEASS
jgi:hypothetical protein